MKRRSLLYIFLFCISFSIKAVDYQSQLYNLFLNGKMLQWQSVINAMEKQVPLTQQNKLEILETYYGLIGHMLDKKMNDQAEGVLKNANKLLDDYLKGNPNSPEALGLKANFLGYQIVLTPVKAPFIAKQMLGSSKKSIQLGQENAFTNILRSNILFYMPSMFGGDLEKALSGYKKALAILERSGRTKDNWLYVQLLVTIAVVYEKNEKYDDAKVVLQKAMRIAPEYKYISQKIYPRLLGKMKA